MRIDIKTILHKSQRYPTVGDWQFKGDCLKVRVSQMSDRRYEWLVALHETIEALLCWLTGVSEADVDRYDMDYETAREAKLKAPCGCKIQDEPGNDKHCPVYRQHQAATLAERAMAKVLKVNWRKYDQEVESL